MKNEWSEKEANSFINLYYKNNISKDLALRVYSSRLLGCNPKLVMHGGGNTSLKSIDKFGNKIIHVKGSGWDMANIEPEGLPAMYLNPLKKLIKLKTLKDEDMVRIQREQLLNIKSPNPSVETLLHAFLPHKYIDHTHSNAILSLTDQSNGKSLIKNIYGDKVGIVDYVMPGFDLAKVCEKIYLNNPEVLGLILLKHGIFTFGNTAKESYDRMIDLVSKAENFIKKGTNIPFANNKNFDPLNIISISSIIRGELSNLANKKILTCFVKSKYVKKMSAGKDINRYALSGPVTPDHAIRIKPFPLIIDGLNLNFKNHKSIILKSLKNYEKKYNLYFSKYKHRSRGKIKKLDSLPRIIFIKGYGAFVVGENLKSLNIVKDLLETTAETIYNAEKIGNFKSISKAHQFDIEYWSLEQAKLNNFKPKTLEGNIVVITGGAGAIGLATALEFKELGAEVIILDNDIGAIKKVSRKYDLISYYCDLKNIKNIEKVFNKISKNYGGLDILISNAGIALQEKIGSIDEKLFKDSFEINFWAHQRVSKYAINIMSKQNIGGVLLFNVSKQALNPGINFGPYGIPKSATLSLMRQYAIDYASIKIRSNAINADRIRSGLLTKDMIKNRSKARGVNEEKYMSGNLLGLEVRAKDVAKAFVLLALAERTTGLIMTVDGGNIAAAPR